ncbi:MULTISPECIES: hypothetical protein [unclassified Paenibacillus]|uniref:hypothetical protein n=1 Tax=unclassified Paenibacillus TaxID=185978 RepID=UPI00097140AF|nr:MULTISPECIES: hypothetical protein [unclassified Paenibacillus]ASS68366.1 hypothetical protein CIC07_21190 [Paenibacillus sp. RUD330]
MARRKWAFRASVLFSILLAVLLIRGCWQMDRVEQQLYGNDLMISLVQLEGLIGQQEERNWDKPDLVTIQLGNVTDNLSTLVLTKLPSKSENRMLQSLYVLFMRYPNRELYLLPEVAQEDRSANSGLRAELRKAGIGIGITMGGGIKEAKRRLEVLREALEERGLSRSRS